MSSQAVQHRITDAADGVLWRSIWIDLGFWSVAGAIAATAAAPLGPLFGVPVAWLVVVGLAFLVIGAGLLRFLNASRPLTRGWVWRFMLFNCIAAPLTWLTALLGWLPLTAAGNWGLAIAGDVMLVLGLYQFYALRRHARR